MLPRIVLAGFLVAGSTELLMTDLRHAGAATVHGIQGQSCNTWHVGESALDVQSGVSRTRR